jgi:hypothetical protein
MITEESIAERAESRHRRMYGDYVALTVDEKDLALCSQTDPEAFFPEKGGSSREAKKICARCPIKLRCLEVALANDERFGIFGGLSERERRRIKRERDA